MKIQHILVPTDISGDGGRPLAPIRELARAHGARITLLHVVPVLLVPPHGAPFAPPLAAPDTQRHVAEARAALEELRAQLELEAEVEVVAAEDIASAVHRFAHENAVDLVALSTHGHTGFRRLVLGSVAESILRHSAAPVLVFPRAK